METFNKRFIAFLIVGIMLGGIISALPVKATYEDDLGERLLASAVDGADYLVDIQVKSQFNWNQPYYGAFGNTEDDWSPSNTAAGVATFVDGYKVLDAIPKDRRHHYGEKVSYLSGAIRGAEHILALQEKDETSYAFGAIYEGYNVDKEVSFRGDGDGKTIYVNDQGMAIIAFSKLSKLLDNLGNTRLAERYLEAANRVADFTINYMGVNGAYVDAVEFHSAPSYPTTMSYTESTSVMALGLVELAMVEPNYKEPLTQTLDHVIYLQDSSGKIASGYDTLSGAVISTGTLLNALTAKSWLLYNDYIEPAPEYVEAAIAFADWGLTQQDPNDGAYIDPIHGKRVSTNAIWYCLCFTTYVTLVTGDPIYSQSAMASAEWVLTAQLDDGSFATSPDYSESDLSSTIWASIANFRFTYYLHTNTILM